MYSPSGTAMETDRRKANQTRPMLIRMSEAKSRSTNRLTKARATARGVGRNSGLTTPDAAVRCQAVRNRTNPNTPSDHSILRDRVLRKARRF